MYEQSSYLATFLCQFDRYIYKRLPFRVTQAADMFQRKIYEIFKFKELPNVFEIADDISVVGYDDCGRNHDNLL